MATGSAGRRRWIFTALLLVAVLSLRHQDASVHAETVAVAESVEERQKATDTELKTVKTTVKITRARMAVAVETTADSKPEQSIEEAERVPVTGAGVEQCREGDAQCAEAPADRMPEPIGEEVSDSVEEDEHAATATIDASLVALQVEVATRYLEEMQQQLREWLPHVKAAVEKVTTEITAAWEALVSAWRDFYSQCVVIYDHFFAEAAATLLSIYRQAAAVASDVHAVVSVWVAVVVDEVQELWQTHEELRIMTHHLVAGVLLAAFAALFFSVYAVAASVPDAVVSLWTSLDDLTRAQLKIVAVLVLSFVVYHLRVMWSFWLLLAAITGFYYWSGHVLAKHTPPLTRQASRGLSAQPTSQGKAKLH